MALAAMAASANAVLATSSPSSHAELAGGGLGERNRSIKVVQDKVLPHLQKIFETHAGPDKKWTKEQIAAFLHDIQHQDSEDSNSSKLLTYDEIDFHKFLGYMTSSSAALTTPPKPTDLSWPLSSYFISSSHNTYLAGKQVFGESTTETYTDVLLRGCRCVEIDVWNGEDDSSSSSSSSSSSDEENSKAKAQKADTKAKKEAEPVAKPAAKDSDSASDPVFGKPKRRSTFGALKSKISRSLSTRLKRPEKRSEKPKGTDSPPAKDSDQATLSTDAVSSIMVEEPGAIEVEPVVTHGHTRTTKITFREVCVAIKESAFVTSDAPLIISLEVHCNPAQQLSMVKIMKEIWGEYLVAERDSEPALLPSPGELKNKILIKVKYSPPEKKLSNEDIQPAAETVEGVKESTEAKETKAVPTAKETTTSPGELKGLNETEKPTEIQLTKETKVPDESKGPSETKAPTETEETKIAVESKVSEEAKEVTLTKETNVSDGRKETKEVTKTKEITLPDGSKEIKETTETKVSNESKEVKEVKETKEAKVAKAPKTIQELSRMGVYTKGVSFKSFTQPEATMTTHIFSLAESTFYMGAYGRTEWGIWEHNKRFMMRTYPSGFRAGSQNLDPSPFWGAGVQIVALNWQKKNSRSMMLNEAMFAGTGGYVLKPPGYHPELEGRSIVKDVVTRKLSLTITFLAAQNIPLPLGDTHDRSFRPYVKVAVYSDSSEEVRGGLIQNKELEREDEYKVKTKSYKGCHIDMGGEKVELKDIPGVVDGLTFVRFTIRDDEIGKDDLAAWACVKLDRLGVGYRFIHLFDANDKLSDGAVLVKVEKKLE